VVSNLEPDPAPTEVGGEVVTIARAERLDGRDVPLGRYTVVRRMLPHANRRTIGAWCFLDHFGPEDVTVRPGMRIPPHPHCGLQTVTWLFDGEIRHRDSLGSVVSIRPGQLNLMTAGRGVAHAEDSPDVRPPALHGLQLWIALPADEAAGPARFEHHTDLPGTEIGGASVVVVVGEYAGVRSPARVHTPIVGAEVRVPAGTVATMPLRSGFEYGVVAVDGSATVDGSELAPGTLLYLGADRTTVPVASGPGARLFLVGGEPFADELVMWWNFVGRSHEEIVAARAQWTAECDGSATEIRFGAVPDHEAAPLPAPDLPSVRLRPRGRTGRRPA
jgi:quercetin 2,3-dioxygenase